MTFATGSPRKPLVLVVDDFADNREMYSEFLSFSGYEVIEAERLPLLLTGLATQFRREIGGQAVDFDTAATISGVKPGDTAANTSDVASYDNNQSRNPPTVKCATGANATAS